ncbi:MAG: MBOAT family protein [Saprospiraceae bacterium]|nr:MBOAT family protein [Saprospiraceae bacterium]
MGFLVHRSQAGKRRFFLIISLIGNLSVLAFFKYTNFFIQSINEHNEYTGFFIQFVNEHRSLLVDLLSRIIDHQSPPQISSLDIILPVGISFFTFQTMSYSIDIYRGKLKPCRNILDFAFFVSFFPQLVAGPIVRAADFIPQIRAKLGLSEQQLNYALWLIIGGLFKKAIISDYISVNFVDRVFMDPSICSGAENLLAVYGYSIQIYCDFSAYSDIAIGLALLMGFRLPDNFNLPYQASSITDFWRRWHISLSSWLRDYLYISMGGNRSGTTGSIIVIISFWLLMSLVLGWWMFILGAVLGLFSILLGVLGKQSIRVQLFTYVNLMNTMLLGGLWHGASWRFVIWGALHGIGLAVERALKPVSKRLPKTLLSKVLGILFTFHFVAFCWIFFRADSFDTAYMIIDKITSSLYLDELVVVIKAYYKVMLLMLLAYILHFLPKKWDHFTQDILKHTPLVLKALLLTVMTWIILQVSNSELQAFIYFQF